MPGTEVTDIELHDLSAAIRNNCRCPTGPALGTQPTLCPACLLAKDPGTIRRLVFYRRYVGALRRAEALEPPRWQAV